MSPYIAHIQKEIEPLRQEIIHHKVYQEIKSIEDLRIFMQYHIYAVWDFMSLLKSLQNDLTCTTIPWVPMGDPETRFLINEIVVGEESDVDLDGNRKSHFELYLDAMIQANANTASIMNFIGTIKNVASIQDAIKNATISQEIKNFTSFTFDIATSKETYLKAAIFTFGREDLIPGMFISIIDKIYTDHPESISVFKYYLERHIEVDGDHHSHLALQMVTSLIKDDTKKWDIALTTTIESLKRRITLWDGVYNEIMNSRKYDK